MKGYKAFEKGMICKGKQYTENTVFEEENAEICQSGMHFCKNPLDVLDYYPLFNEKGEMTEFAEVEALDEPKTDDNKKYCTKKLKIGAKLSLGELIKSSFSFIKESFTSDKKGKTRKKDNSQLAASGLYSKLSASGDSSQLELNGKKSVGANIGKNGIIKGKKGNWIVLAEYDKGGIPLCVKSAQIDGRKIKEDTFYKLENGEFIEV